MAHAQYLTYDEYTGYGGTLLAAAFPPLELKSRKRIDRLTDSRVQGMETIPDAVKMCMYSLINIENAAGTEAQAVNPAVTSFSTDGYSEAYGHALDANAATVQMDKTVGDYLFGEKDDNGVMLLYRGVRG